jgi:acyl carrier protein
MPEKKYRDELIQVFRVVFPGSDENQVPDFAQFSNEDWDSLKHIELITELEEFFELRFTNSEIAEMNSFQAILDFVNSRSIAES